MQKSLAVMLFLILFATMVSAGEAKVVNQEANRITFRVLKNGKWSADRRTYTHSKSGAGVGFRADGWVLTTAHQLRGADSLILICPDGVGRAADRWQWSNCMDIGVAHIPDYEVPVAKFGDSEPVAIGDTVFAAGRPFNLPFGLSRGIISGLHAGLLLDGERTEHLQDYIQFDAQANPGNSGGPLLSGEGQMLGLVCESLSALPRSLPGVSFAIPVAHARRLGERLIANPDKLHHAGLKVLVADCNAWPLEERKRLDYWRKDGAILFDLEPSAGRAGLLEEDIVTAVDNIPVANWVHLRALLGLRKPGDKVQLDLHRKGKAISLTVQLVRVTYED